nr:hypothetical protein [Nitrosopumilus sp.]
MSQTSKKLLQDDSGKLVEPEKIDYRYLLNHENKSVLLSLAKIASLDSKISAYSKESLVNFLSDEIPKVLTTMVQKLNSRDHLACEIVVSAGGYMPLWEVNPRLSIEFRRQKISEDSLNEKQSEKNGWIKKQKNINFEYISGVDEEDEGEEDDYIWM